ncbi:MAG: hypothetical protein E6K18_01090, partial [Methanobacteriota archaeon]
TDGTGTWNRSAGAFGWSGRAFPDDTASFDPFQNLPFSASITVTLRAAIARDPAGNPLDGNGDGTPDGSPQDDVVWSFAIETRDLTPPTVVGINPANGATDVRETTGVTTTFSEAMNATTVEDGFSLWDAVRTWTGADGSFVWGPGGDVVAYTPAGTLSMSPSPPPPRM